MMTCFGTPEETTTTIMGLSVRWRAEARECRITDDDAYGGVGRGPDPWLMAAEIFESAANQLEERLGGEKDLSEARKAVEEISYAQSTRPPQPEVGERAAALLADVWQVFADHGMRLGDRGLFHRTTHDVLTAAKLLEMREAKRRNT
jgi:hypothetical protein